MNGFCARAAIGLSAMLLPCAAASSAERFVRIDDKAAYPESVTATKDGALYFGSITKGTLYRAPPDADKAEPWLDRSVSGLQHVLGVFADDAANRLWVCDAGVKPKDASPTQNSRIVVFDLSTKAQVAAFAFEGGGSCNDLVILDDGSAFATDFEQGRVMRLRPGGDRFEPFAVSPELAGADGITANGNTLYVNGFHSGRMFAIAIGSGGEAGPLRPLMTDRPLVRPDGMRFLAPDKIIAVEEEGRLIEMKIDGDSLKVRTLQDGFRHSPTSLALVGGSIFVVEAKFAFLRTPDADPGEFGAREYVYAPRP